MLDFFQKSVWRVVIVFGILIYLFIFFKFKKKVTTPRPIPTHFFDFFKIKNKRYKIA
jgi:hypothetical protein